jgi:BMFP domain-containing protein YqiC
MIDSKKINGIVSEVLGAIPSGVKQLPNELETMLRTAMLEVFNKMELVTREEFDVQTKVLARTREKLDAMQQRLDALEK